MGVIRKGDDLKELSKIGKKIAEAFRAIDEVGITEEECDLFMDYVRSQQAIMPMFDPTRYMQGGDNLLDAGMKRAQAIRAFLRGGD